MKRELRTDLVTGATEVTAVRETVRDDRGVRKRLGVDLEEAHASYGVTLRERAELRYSMGPCSEQPEATKTTIEAKHVFEMSRPNVLSRTANTTEGSVAGAAVESAIDRPDVRAGPDIGHLTTRVEVTTTAETTEGETSRVVLCHEYRVSLDGGTLLERRVLCTV